MKTIRFFSLILFTAALLGMISCKRDKAAAPSIPVSGVWIGYYTVTNDPTQYYLSFDLKTDGDPNLGIVNVYDAEGNASQVGTGSFTLTDKTLDIVFTYTGNSTQLAYTAQYDSSTGTISNGTWGLKPNKTGGGTWSMTKQ